MQTARPRVPALPIPTLTRAIHETAIVDESRRSEFTVLVEGGSAEDRAAVEARVKEVLPPPGVSHAIRNAMQIIVGGGLESGTIVTFERDDMARVEQLLEKALEADACREALVTSDVTPTTDDAAFVQQFVDDFDERPHRIGVRHLELLRRIERLEAMIGIGDHIRSNGAAL